MGLGVRETEGQVQVLDCFEEGKGGGEGDAKITRSGVMRLMHMECQKNLHD